MNQELKKKITEIAEEFASCDGAYSDNSMLEIDPATLSVRLTDEEDFPERDYYDIMDLMEADIDRPDKWRLFDAAIEEIASNY